MITVPCKFDGCGLHFESKYELVYHVEVDHIPSLKKRRMQYLKEICDNKLDGEDHQETRQHSKQERLYALYNQPMPMSLLCKLHPFSTTHKVCPVPVRTLSLNFCHYRKKPTIAASIKPDDSADLLSNGSGSMDGERRQPQIPSKRIPSSSSMVGESGITSPSSSDVKSAKELRNSSTIAGALNTPMSASIHEERRFRCDVDGCKKTYKNQQGLRAHIRNAHSSTASATVLTTAGNGGGIATPQRLTPAEESILNRQLPGSAHHALVTTPQHYSSSTGNSSGSSTAAAAATVPTSGYPVYAARGPPVDGGSDTSGVSSNYVIVSMAQPQSTDITVASGMVGSNSNAAVTTVRQVIQSQAAAAAAAGDSSGGGSSHLYLAGGRFPLQRSNLSGKYSCQYCPKTYKTMMNLNKHIQENHPKHAISGMAYTSTTSQFSSSPIGGRSQSPKSHSGTSRSGYITQTISSLSPNSQQQCYQYQSIDRKAVSPANSQSGVGSGLSVAATPPSTAGGYGMSQKISAHQQQQLQPYYMAASPAAQNRQHASGEYTYSPMPSAAGTSHQSTAIFATQSSPAPGQMSQVGSQADGQTPANLKYASWSEQPPTGDFSRPSSADAGGGQQPAVIVDRSVTVQAGPPGRSTMQQQPQQSTNLQMQGQPIGQRSMANSQTVAVARQSQYYQSPLQQQQPRQIGPGIIMANNASTPYSQTAAPTTINSATNSLPPGGNATTTIRISSLKQYHHAQQQPSQQQQIQSNQQQQPQYIQIQQQPQQHSFAVPTGSQQSQQQHLQSHAQQAVSISSQPPPPPQYQITGSPSYVVRTSSVHHSPCARYVAQHQPPPYGNEGQQPQRIIASSPHTSMTGGGRSKALANASPAGGATMAQVGGGNTVYYRTNASMASGQPVILRTAPAGSQATGYVQQPSAVRMIPVISGAGSGDYSSQRMSAGQQQMTQGGVYQSQQQYSQQQPGQGQQPSGPAQQQSMVSTGQKSHAVHRARNVYSNSGNTVILQQGAQSQQASYSYGNGSDDSASGGSSNQSSSISTLLNSSLPYASTAAALAGADPSTPIRAIVSRGLAEHGVNRYNYAGARGNRLDTDNEGRVSFHYRAVPSAVNSSAAAANQQHDYGKTSSSSYVSGPSADANQSTFTSNSQLLPTQSKVQQSTAEISTSQPSTNDCIGKSGSTVAQAPASEPN